MAKRLPKAFLPRAGRRAALRLPGYRTLDLRGGVREGCLSVAQGVDPACLPELCVMPTPKKAGHTLPGTPLSIHVIDGRLYAVTNQDGNVFLYCYRDGGVNIFDLGTEDTVSPRVLLPFNYYGKPNEPLQGSSFRKAVIFPDAKMCKIDSNPPTLHQLARGYDMPIPPLSHACVYLSRVFGVCGDRVYASNFNAAGYWNYDTAEDISATHAWVTTSQSSTRARGDFTGIAVYDGQVLAFKEGFCQVVRNTRNPFRLSDLMTVGTVDGRSIAEAGGYLFFAGRGQVYRYDGDSAREIGDSLAVTDYSGSIGAGVGGLYYLYVPQAKGVFVYSPKTDAWTMLSAFTSVPIVGMAATDTVCYFLDADGVIYTTEGATPAAMYAEAAPLISAGGDSFRLFRLRLTLTAAQGASLTVSYQDTKGVSTPLLTYTGTGETRRIISRTLSPADYGGRLIYQARGKVHIHTVELVTQTAETDE